MTGLTMDDHDDKPVKSEQPDTATGPLLAD